MVSRAAGPGDDSQVAALTTLAGRRQFASEIPAVPELLDSRTWKSLDQDKRDAYDDDRIAHHSRLLVVQTLSIATRTGAEASDTPKYFSERIPATFVLAGINVERAGLLSGPRGEQIAGRYSMIRTGPFPRDSQWATLVSAVEGSLRLHRHQPGTLPDLAGYLHQRTSEMIGSLLWPIRSAAIQAVIDGTEKITRKSMDAIAVDIASQADKPARGKP
jgi:hypothetical protein